MKVSKDAEMIDFWRENHAVLSVLPQLYKVACRVLCVPASSAASERVFSTAGRLLENRRTKFTNLNPESTNALLFLHSIMK